MVELDDVIEWLRTKIIIDEDNYLVGRAPFNSTNEMIADLENFISKRILNSFSSRIELSDTEKERLRDFWKNN